MLGRYDFESEPSGRTLKETNEERLERLVKKRECLNWIVKVNALQHNQ